MYISMSYLCSTLENTTFIQFSCFTQPCHCHLWQCWFMPRLRCRPDARGSKTSDLGPATWPFSSCNCFKGDLPPPTGSKGNQKDRTLICNWIYRPYVRNGFWILLFFFLPTAACCNYQLSTCLVIFCKHHFDILRGLTMARCSQWDQVMITQRSNDHLFGGWHCHARRLESLYSLYWYGLSH